MVTTFLNNVMAFTNVSNYKMHVESINLLVVIFISRAFDYRLLICCPASRQVENRSGIERAGVRRQPEHHLGDFLSRP
jgi:hypothetical protein